MKPECSLDIYLNSFFQNSDGLGDRGYYARFIFFQALALSNHSKFLVFQHREKKD